MPANTNDVEANGEFFHKNIITMAEKRGDVGQKYTNKRRVFKSALNNQRPESEEDARRPFQILALCLQ